MLLTQPEENSLLLVQHRVEQEVQASVHADEATNVKPLVKVLGNGSLHSLNSPFRAKSYDLPAYALKKGQLQWLVAFDRAGHLRDVIAAQTLHCLRA